MADISQLLADKMLQGWCMLNKECPVCRTPIMKSRQNEELCVNCGVSPLVPAPAVTAEQEEGKDDWERVKRTLKNKAFSLSDQIEKTQDTVTLQSLCSVLKTYLETLKLLQEIQAK